MKTICRPKGPWKKGKVKWLFEVQGGKCAHCGELMPSPPGTNEPDSPSLDHVVPRSMGGKNSGNLILAHRRCNEQRGQRNLSAHAKAVYRKVCDEAESRAA